MTESKTGEIDTGELLERKPNAAFSSAKRPMYSCAGHLSRLLLVSCVAGRPESRRAGYVCGPPHVGPLLNALLFFEAALCDWLDQAVRWCASALMQTDSTESTEPE